MAGRLFPVVLLLLLLPSPARASSTQESAAEDSRRCPRLEDGLPPFANALRSTCRVSAEGYPAEEVRFSHSSILARCGDRLGIKIRSFGVVAGESGSTVHGGSLGRAKIFCWNFMLMPRNSCPVHTTT
jgi:hypothetical protein